MTQVITAEATLRKEENFMDDNRSAEFCTFAIKPLKPLLPRDDV